MPLAAHVDRLRIPEGRALAHEGWRVREVLVVLSGEIIAIRGGEDCARIGPGTHIGAAELLRGGTYSATLLASTGLQLLVINGPAYRWAVQALPGFEPEIDGGLGVWPQVSVAQGPMPPMRSGVMRST
jgi:CRP-like cAMP-binding protein